MTDRDAYYKAQDDLTALIFTACPDGGPDLRVSDLLATAVLARWRLVPVEEACRCIAGNEHYKSDHAEQHRAADELTHHDQAADIYESNGIVYCGECNQRISRGHAPGCSS